MKKLFLPLLGFLMILSIISLNACSSSKKINKSDVSTPVMEEQAETTPGNLLSGKHEDVDFSISCVECHEQETPEQVEEWEKGMHGQVNVGCFVCHGDGEVEFYPEAITLKSA
ncbi:MAG: hypothetical protein ACE5GL_01975 [Calditrichia bacterium]